MRRNHFTLVVSPSEPKDLQNWPKWPCLRGYRAVNCSYAASEISSQVERGSIKNAAPMAMALRCRTRLGLRLDMLRGLGK